MLCGDLHKQQSAALWGSRGTLEQEGAAGTKSRNVSSLHFLLQVYFEITIGKGVGGNFWKLFEL